MEETKQLYEVYESDYDKVQTAKSHFADEHDVPYDECRASRIGSRNHYIAVVHHG